MPRRTQNIYTLCDVHDAIVLSDLSFSPSTEKSCGSKAHLATLCALDVVRELHAFVAVSMYSFH